MSSSGEVVDLYSQLSQLLYGAGFSHGVLLMVSLIVLVLVFRVLKK